MAKVSVVVVDDTQQDAALLQEKLEIFPEVDTVQVFTKPLNALTNLSTQQPDILFLDMEMPGITGLELYRSLPSERRPVLVIVTAHSKFSLDGFKVDAADFIMKPIDFASVAEALRKSMRRLGLPLDLPVQTDRQYAFFKVKDGGYQNFLVRDIKWIESLGNYAQLHDRNATYEIRYTIRELEMFLVGLPFLRIHKAFIVNIDFVAQYASGKITLLDGQEITVSRTYKPDVDALIIGRKRGTTD